MAGVEFDFVVAGPSRRHTEPAQKCHRGADIAQPGNIANDERFVGEHRGHHDGQRGIFAATQFDAAAQRHPAVNNHSIHQESAARRRINGNEHGLDQHCAKARRRRHALTAGFIREDLNEGRWRRQIQIALPGEKELDLTAASPHWARSDDRGG